ncbi:hypothetical protein BCR34DRAFT_343223 [Clohesyomyces aquaticus]|uniref:Uncharacterized protein n=1 Tax=Clohesyomyces aquaticus TaxID=1231657 RepID=A0A1Y2A755_9PLEO|nr:hypothetical protein BCR34DRAFT_343223 [Clohesyomyces aquaticus]
MNVENDSAECRARCRARSSAARRLNDIGRGSQKGIRVAMTGMRSDEVKSPRCTDIAFELGQNYTCFRVLTADPTKRVQCPRIPCMAFFFGKLGAGDSGSGVLQTAIARIHALSLGILREAHRRDNDRIALRWMPCGGGGIGIISVVKDEWEKSFARVTPSR